MESLVWIQFRHEKKYRSRGTMRRWHRFLLSKGGNKVNLDMMRKVFNNKYL